MRPEVTLYMAASLDGFIARRDGSIDWLPPISDHEDYGYAEFLNEVDTLVMGRKTYDAARERHGDDPFDGRPCIVFSRHRAGQRTKGVRFTAEEPADVVRELRRGVSRVYRGAHGAGVGLVGGGEIVRDCFEAGIVNNIILTIIPVLLGDGRPLFLPRGGTTWLRLRDCQSHENGIVQLRYDSNVPRVMLPPPERVEYGELVGAL